MVDGIIYALLSCIIDDDEPCKPIRMFVGILTSRNFAWHTSNNIITILLLCMRYKNNTVQTP